MNFSLRTMLLGIALILVGLYIQGDSGNDLYGYSYILVIVGFLSVIVGYFKNGIKKMIDK